MRRNFKDDGAHDRDVCDCCPDVPLDTEWLAATCARPVTVGCPGLRLTVNRRETHLNQGGAATPCSSMRILQDAARKEAGEAKTAPAVHVLVKVTPPKAEPVVVGSC